MVKLIKIDTTGGKYPTNIHLYNAIVPNIKSLIYDSGEVVSAKEIDWDKTAKDYDGGNGHCIEFKEDAGYVAAYEFNWMIVDVEEYHDVQTLSELCEEVALELGIEWSGIKQV